MNDDQKKCQDELDENGLVLKKYYGQVFTTDPQVINDLIDTIKGVFKPGSKVVEIGGGLGYITQELAQNFESLDVIEYDKALFEKLSLKIGKRKGLSPFKKSKLNLIYGDILEYDIPEEDYILVGNIPFHLSGQIYRKFMSEADHKPYAVVFITDKQYAKTLMGQPPRCYRVSLQAQAYGDIEIIRNVTPDCVFPEPKVTCCIMKITQNDTIIPENFWKTVNYHWDNFPTDEVESPKTMGLKKWIELAEKTL